MLAVSTACGLGTVGGGGSVFLLEFSDSSIEARGEILTWRQKCVPVSKSVIRTDSVLPRAMRHMACVSVAWSCGAFVCPIVSSPKALVHYQALDICLGIALPNSLRSPRARGPEFALCHLSYCPQSFTPYPSAESCHADLGEELLA